MRVRLPVLSVILLFFTTVSARASIVSDILQDGRLDTALYTVVVADGQKRPVAETTLKLGNSTKVSQIKISGKKVKVDTETVIVLNVETSKGSAKFFVPEEGGIADLVESYLVSKNSRTRYLMIFPEGIDADLSSYSNDPAVGLYVEGSEVYYNPESGFSIPGEATAYEKLKKILTAGDLFTVLRLRTRVCLETVAHLYRAVAGRTSVFVLVRDNNRPCYWLFEKKKK